jgi:hypothetical protein
MLYVERAMRLLAARFYNPNVTDRIATVTAQLSADRERFVIQVKRGPKANKLRESAGHGPFSEEVLQSSFREVVEAIEAEGYWEAGVQALLADLETSSAANRARAALRLGWRRCRRAVDKLLAVLPDAVDDLCSFIDALGAIGDPRAAPPLREVAARKLLSRRRSAVEALRKLGDEEGLSEARQRALERLPLPLQERLTTLDESIVTGPIVDELASQVLALGAATALATAEEPTHLTTGEQGLIVDTLYELGTPLAVGVSRALLVKTRFDRPHLWRYVKSVFKRSLLRHDHVTFGWLSHEIEAQARKTAGTTASVKSGYDGKQRQTNIFGRNTQDYLRRLAWRYLRNLARYRPEAYPYAAAEALIHYTPEDATAGPNAPHQYGGCYLLHRIVWGNSKRFRFSAQKLRHQLRKVKFAQAPDDLREEAFPDLWDAEPRAYLRILTRAKLAAAHVFAARAVSTAHLDVLRSASHAEVVALLDAPYEPTVQLGLSEVERRFDPANPEWGLLHQLLHDERPTARTLGQRWLRLTAPLWLRDTNRILTFLALPHPNLRALVVELVVGIVLLEPALRQELAVRVLATLRDPAASADAQDGCALLISHALGEEVNALVPVEELAAWAIRGAGSVREAAGRLLSGRPEALRELGLERITTLAQNEVAAVRAAAHAMLRSAAELQADPSVLFVLVESEWEDTRNLAFELLRTRVNLEALGLDGLTALLDSNRTDVQDLGKELAARHMHALPGDELVFRLVQHPHPNLRRFAFELVTQHLPPGAEALTRIKVFARSALLSLAPDRALKRKVVRFLIERGLQDAGQAAIVSALLGDVVRVQGRSDFEDALEALVRFRLSYPELETTVRLVPGGVA